MQMLTAGHEQECYLISADEIANVNIFNDDIVHVLQNTIESRINSATDRRYSSQPEVKH